MSKLSTLLRKIADANKAQDLLNQILKLDNCPLEYQDIQGLINEIERIKVTYANEVEQLDK